MSDRDTSFDASVPAAGGESGALDGGGDTIELAFTGMELDEFLRDPAMHGDLSDWLAPQIDAVVVSPLPSTADTQSDAPAFPQDDLLTALRDDTFPGGGEDVLEAAARVLEPMADDKTFLLTEIEIGDLIGDFEQALAPGLGSEAEFLDPFVSPPSALPPGELSPVMIEIEDELGVAAAHILT